MLQLSPQQIQNFQEKILSWYAQHQRDLPWRKTRDPYSILISEVMSQQTQLSRVIPKYEAWIKKFPTVAALANASVSDVLTYWSGLGYNRRALYLQKVAQMLVSQDTQKIRKIRNSGTQSFSSILNITWPQTEKELMQLPGIGQYTARAILCFAFDRQIAVLDTNVRRVILTQFQISNAKSQISNNDLQSIADQLLPHGKAYEWNQALMDYSAAVLRNEKIPTPKQSKFRDSDRYYRGQILKVLIEKKQINHSELHDYFNKKEQIIHQERLIKIIDTLLKDKLIEKEKDSLFLPK